MAPGATLLGISERWPPARRVRANQSASAAVSRAAAPVAARNAPLQSPAAQLVQLGRIVSSQAEADRIVDQQIETPHRRSRDLLVARVLAQHLPACALEVIPLLGDSGQRHLILAAMKAVVPRNELAQIAVDAVGADLSET